MIISGKDNYRHVIDYLLEDEDKTKAYNALDEQYDPEITFDNCDRVIKKSAQYDGTYALIGMMFCGAFALVLGKGYLFGDASIEFSPVENPVKPWALERVVISFPIKETRKAEANEK